MQRMNCQLIILAAGNGSRMNSELPKVMHKVGERTMIDMVISHALEVTQDVILVHSSQLEKYIESYRNMSKFVLQSNPLGTAHAVYTALDLVDNEKIVAVLYGDNPLITVSIISDLLEHLIVTNSAITTLSFKRDNPNEYGRIVTDECGNFLKIVEAKEANDEELAITICNSGIMAFGAGVLQKYLTAPFVENIGAVKELYLTSLIEIAQKQGEKVSYFLSPYHNLVLGVNTKQELEEANQTLYKLARSSY